MKKGKQWKEERAEGLSERICSFIHLTAETACVGDHIVEGGSCGGWDRHFCTYSILLLTEGSAMEIASKNGVNHHVNLE
jgi:hypothetical protein